jgi:hypothetical protein
MFRKALRYHVIAHGSEYVKFLSSCQEVGDVDSVQEFVDVADDDQVGLVTFPTMVLDIDIDILSKFVVCVEFMDLDFGLLVAVCYCLGGIR